MVSKVGFAMCLIGAGGMAEAYGNAKQMIISIALISVGALMMRLGDEKVHIDRRDYSSNILDRLRFLP